MYRINCSHLDVSHGIYQSLRTSVSEHATGEEPNDSNLSGKFPVDSSLTNSEISILTKYAEEQVANAPQYLISSLWKWCEGNYNITQTVDSNGNPVYVKHHDELKCSGLDSKFSIFDYRNDLANSGLEGVLAYAFETSDYLDSTYLNEVKDRENAFKLVAPLLITNCVITVAIFVFQYILYSNRKGSSDFDTLPRFLFHVLAALTVVGCILVTVAAGIITSVIFDVRKGIKSSLGSFGIVLHTGRLWFTLLWLTFAGSLVLMTTWVAAIWCANPTDDDEYNQNYTFQRSGDVYNNSRGPRFSRTLNRNVSTTNKSSTSSNEKLNPRDRLLYASSSEDDDDDNNNNTPEEPNYGPFYDDEISSQVLNNYHEPSHVFDYREQEESDLRKLGEKLSRKTSVRHLKKSTSTKSKNRLNNIDEDQSSRSHHLQHNPLSLDKTKDMIYHDTNNESHHYRVDTFNGYESENLARNPSIHSKPLGNYPSRNTTVKLQESNPSITNPSTTNNFSTTNNPFNSSSSSSSSSSAAFRSNSIQERHFNPSRNPFLTQDRQNKGHSYLNDDEVDFLESNNFINRLE